jgi:hypothetical protein
MQVWREENSSPEMEEFAVVSAITNFGEPTEKPHDRL